MHVYSRKGYWWVDAKYWDAASGKRKRVQRSTGIRDDGSAGAKRTAAIVAEDIARSVAVGTNRKARQETVKDAFEASLRAKRRDNKSDATVEIVLEKFKRILDVFPPDMQVRDLTDKHLEKYADQALLVRKPGSVHRELLELRSGIRALGMTPPKMPRLGKVSQPRERWLTPEETVRLLAVVPAKRQDHVRIYRLLGLRKSELFQISAPDVDLLRRAVRVRGTKTEKADRTLPLVGEAYDILKRRAVSQPSGPLFEAWGDGNADRDLRRWADKAGLGELSFNDLRRSFATELALKGVPSLHLAHLLGHTSTRMVEAIYARIKAGEHLHDAVLQLDNYSPSTLPPSPREEAPTETIPRPAALPSEITSMSPASKGNLDTMDEF